MSDEMLWTIDKKFWGLGFDIDVHIWILAVGVSFEEKGVVDFAVAIGPLTMYLSLGRPR